MTKPDWETTKKKYPLGNKVEGTIRKVWKLGARIELDDGATGVLRNKELSWDQPVADVTTFLHEGKSLYEGRRVKVAVLHHDLRKRQFVFSLRQAVYDPWEHQGDRYLVGKPVRGVVISLSQANATVEFEDHVTGRLPRGEIAPWAIDSIENVLEQGDTIEAKVKSRDETAREIVLSMKERLEEIGQEFLRPGEKGSIWVAEPGSREKLEGDEKAIQPLEGSLRQIEHILIVDDVEEEVLYLEEVLNDLGYENVDSKTDFAEAVQVAIEGKYDLILMDAKGPGDDFAGLHAAQTIRREKPETLIALVTGYDVPEISREGQRLELAGMILKPVTFESLAGAMVSLEKVGHAGWPVRLPENGQRAIKFVQDISRAAAVRRSLPEVLSGILKQIAKATQADKAAIFSMDPRTSWVEMPAAIEISQESVRNWRYLLPKSPVNDVIYRGEHIFENYVEMYEGKYRNLRRVVGFNSCIGVPVPGGAGDLGYGLFLLHEQEGHFSDDDLVRAEAAAAIIGQAIREDWVIRQVAADQRLTLLGSTITSVGHELRGRLGALEAVVFLEQAWRRLIQNRAYLSDPEFVHKVERDLEGLKAARQGMAELADILLGAVKQRQEQALDVRACVQSAIAMVVHQAAKARVELLPRLSWVPLVRSNPLELEQVFMNLLLNAIQQMPRAQRQRGRVTIETSFDQGDRRFPVKIRFTDSGPGIHNRHLEKIFEPMYTTKAQGTGMGLYICRELLAMMGGQVRVEQTAILAGTTFLVELPRA